MQVKDSTRDLFCKHCCHAQDSSYKITVMLQDSFCKHCVSLRLLNFLAPSTRGFCGLDSTSYNTIVDQNTDHMHSTCMQSCTNAASVVLTVHNCQHKLTVILPLQMGFTKDVNAICVSPSAGIGSTLLNSVLDFKCKGHHSQLHLHQQT